MSDFEIQHLRIAEIRIGDRHRKDLGDLEVLAASIGRGQLLQPIGVTPGLELIWGHRRLLACRDVLGWEAIPARTVQVPSIAQGEHDENLLRKEFTPSERVAIVETLRGYVHGGDRKSDRGRKCDVDRLTVGEAARLVGDSKDDYFRAKKVVERGVPELVQAMDSGAISISAAAEIARAEPEVQRAVVSQTGREAASVAREVRVQRNKHRIGKHQEDERAALASLPQGRAWTITEDQAVVPCVLMVFDPPYGITDEPWEPEDLESFTRDWACRWSASGADFIAVFWSQRHEREGRDWLDESLAGYEFQQKLVWHASNNMQPKSRRLFKQTWEPIFVYRRSGCERLVHDHEKDWTGELHDKDCHIAAVPQTTFSGEDLKRHPCQKPVSVMRWLIHALTRPGERVGSLFCGVSPCGIAALQLGRTYYGIEVNPEYRRIAEGRMAKYGKPDSERQVGGPPDQHPGGEPGVPLIEGKDLLPVVFRRLEMLESDVRGSELGEEGHLLIDRTIEILRRLQDGGPRPEVAA